MIGGVECGSEIGGEEKGGWGSPRGNMVEMGWTGIWLDWLDDGVFAQAQ